jgi:hypothetical protein
MMSLIEAECGPDTDDIMLALFAEDQPEQEESSVTPQDTSDNISLVEADISSTSTVDLN